MSSTSRVWGSCRALAVRSRVLAPRRTTAPVWICQAQVPRRRLYSDDAKDDASRPPRDAVDNKTIPKAAEPVAPSPHADVVAESQPEVSVDEASAVEAVEAIRAVEAIQETQETIDPAEIPIEEDAPEASSDSPVDKLNDEQLERFLYGGRMATSATPGGLTSAQEDTLYREGHIPSALNAQAMLDAGNSGSGPGHYRLHVPEVDEKPTHKFPLPETPYPEDFNMKKRYHPVLEQITRLLMRHGELSVAQRNMAMVMNYLRTAPAPIYSPKFPLLPGRPPPTHLPLNPILYITIAIDSVAPLVRISYLTGAAGGGRSLEVPRPLKLRQRRRVAFQWILDVINKKQSKGSGKKQLPHRIAEEIIAVVEGRSSVWEKRTLVHRQGTATRANVDSNRKAKKRK